MNPDDGGNPLPTIVRVYQLNDASALETARFEDVWRDASETLGRAMLRMDEFVLYPASEQRQMLELDSGLTHVAGVGVFRQPAGVSWRSIVEVPSREESCEVMPPLRFFLDGNRIEGRWGETLGRAGELKADAFPGARPTVGPDPPRSALVSRSHHTNMQRLRAASRQADARGQGI